MTHSMRTLLIAFLSLIAFLPACAAKDMCQSVSFDDGEFTVCEVPAGADIRLFHSAPDETVIGTFSGLRDHLESQDLSLVMAMNAGMYHDDRRPVGLYIEEGKETARIQPRPGPGNFGLLPNGIFYIDETGPHVLETLAYQAADLSPRFATQSGPMLVIDGELHPKFRRESDSRKRRNGVGVSADGGTVYFAISDGAVNFHHFARLFRDKLNTPNALFLDGVVSRLYVEESGRSDFGRTMGPIVGVVSENGQN